MAQTLRAVYENGRLRLLDDVALDEGEEVDIIVTRRAEALSERDRIREALGDSADWPEPAGDLQAELDAELEEVRKALKGLRSLSEIIIEEREGR